MAKLSTSSEIHSSSPDGKNSPALRRPRLRRREVPRGLGSKAMVATRMTLSMKCVIHLGSVHGAFVPG